MTLAWQGRLGMALVAACAAVGAWKTARRVRMALLDGAWVTPARGDIERRVRARHRRLVPFESPPESSTDAEWLVQLNNCRSITSHGNAVRGQCAALVVRDGRVLSWGFARSLLRASRAGKKGQDHADLHAEADAICAAALNGISLEGATIYVTIMCCRSCFALVAGAGISRVVTPPAPSASYTAANAEHNKLIADALGIEICDDAIMPAYQRDPCPRFLPSLTRRIP
ncbi:hypothetical protein T492DRAFT_537645 [Pavlovales sp. CCMP2436]|nr:hypothetical protein T492DRAFT_537645 [Pavlovales sp. CCMP2436]